MTTTTSSSVAGTRKRARWTDLATLGFGMAIAGILMLLVAVLAWGLDTEGETAFFGVVLVIALVGLILVRRFGTWAKAVGSLLSLMVAMALWWTAFGLLAGPSSFFEFLAGLLVLPGAFIALGSCIAAIVAKRRGHVGNTAAGRERTTVRVVLAIIAVAAVAAGIMTPLSRSTASATGSEATSIMKDFEFLPVSYSVAGGSTVFVRNDDPFIHDFTVDDLGIEVRLTPGSSKLITIPAKPGSYILYCTFHTETPKAPEDSDMAGTLTVT